MEVVVEQETTGQVWQRIQKLREERTILATDLDMLWSPERANKINAQIRREEARYRELGGILHGSYAEEGDDY
jgi:hypothetical protein